ncbi:geranylgeranyl reductase family protein [Actinokineospora guangxiensis]|uniref:Geranylgeranyl reductase family protein n=1 Tax=Actinokineospora guangxiensis TaxID=1490288 RepID=A0ABW0EZA9_9PSEU
MAGEWDLVVVGAGPAGSATALAALRADPAARVLLLDSADFPRDKVCGDGVAPHAMDVLADLGVDIAELTAGTEPVTRLTVVSPGGIRFARPFARPAFVVPRVLFDHRLLCAAQAAGAVLRKHRVRTISAGGGRGAGVDAPVVIDGGIRARVVVGADGAESVIRRQCGARPAPAGTVAIAVRGYAPAHAFVRGEQLLTLAAEHWPAYAWAFPVGDGTANIGYGEVIRRDPPTRKHLTERLHALVPGLDGVPLRGHRLPLSPGRPEIAHGRVLLTGDAASLINPLTGEGIYYAVLSGSLAGAAAMTQDPARAYRHSLRHALGTHLRHTTLLARLTRHPWPLDLAAEAARADRRAFDGITEIGLGAGTLDRHLLAALATALPRFRSRRAGRPHSRQTGAGDRKDADVD